MLIGGFTGAACACAQVHNPQRLKGNLKGARAGFLLGTILSMSFCCFSLNNDRFSSVKSRWCFYYCPRTDYKVSGCQDNPKSTLWKIMICSCNIIVIICRIIFLHSIGAEKKILPLFISRGEKNTFSEHQIICERFIFSCMCCKLS